MKININMLYLPEHDADLPITTLAGKVISILQWRPDGKLPTLELVSGHRPDPSSKFYVMASWLTRYGGEQYDGFPDSSSFSS